MSRFPDPRPDDAPIPVLCGPTASGKSAAALEAAARLPIEIVSVDSAQVYRGLDIGTAKPGAAERAAVAHHLIDVADPVEAYSAARFAREARAAIEAIRARGRLPLLAGGTMLYLRALAEGLDDLPGADAAVRARLDAEARALGWPALHARLARVDPDTARRLQPADAQRIQRALEVHELTGQPMSRLLALARQAAATFSTDAPAADRSSAGSPPAGAPGAGPHPASPHRAVAPANAAPSGSGLLPGDRPAPQPRLRLALVSLEPADRAVLHARIGQRFDAMLAAGLLDEVRALRARGDLHAGLPSMRCVGYRQAWEHLDGRYDLDGLRERAAAATRQLAKRQLTWLRAMPARIVVDCNAPDAARQAARHVERIAQEGTYR